MEREVEWEKSKENVQPKKRGRRVEKLNPGLTSRAEQENLSKIKLEKEKFETTLRTYSGDDPLSVWSKYINWTEEHFPSGGKTAHLQKLLQSCVRQFEQCEKYKNDERFIWIWIKFAGKCKEPCEVYQRMYNKKIGRQSAEFYKSWALAAEDLGKTKMADKIFVQGISVGAEPTDTLKRAREKFDTRTCRSMVASLSTSDEPDEDTASQCKTLVPLACSSRGRVPFDRVSSARPEVTATHNAGKLTAPQKPVQIVLDENDQGQCHPIQGQASDQSRLPDAKENRLAGQSMEKAEKKGLSGDASHPIFISPDQGDYFIQELPMYDKTKVYAGVIEYSFEELRALKWQQAMEKTEKEQEAASLLQTHKAMLQDETEQQISKLAQLHKHFSQKIAEEKLSIQDQLKVDLRSLVVQSIREVKEELYSDLNALRAELTEIKATEVGRRHELEQLGTRTPADKSNTSRSAGSISFKRHRTPDSSSAKRSLIKNSPLSVTEDCAHLMNRFFNQTLAASAMPKYSANEEPSQENGPTTLDRPANLFQVYADPTEQEIPLNEPARAQAPFTIFTDAKLSQPESMEVPAPPSEGVIGMASNTKHNHQSLTPVDASHISIASDQLPFGKSFSAFKRPQNASTGHLLQHKSLCNSISVFTDSSSHQDAPGSGHAGDGPQVLPHPNQENEPDPKPDSLESRPVSGSESVDSQTDMEIRAKFFQATGAVSSTPFGNENQLSDIGISEIKLHKPMPFPKRSSIAPIDFAPTQVLSPICEQSRESVSASRSTVSSDGSHQMGLTNAACSSNSNMCLTRVAHDMARTRSHSSSDSDNMGSVDSHCENSVVQSKSKARQSSHELDVVKEESGEMLQKATPVIDTTFYHPPDLTEAQLNATVLIDPSNPFSESLQCKLLQKVDLASFEDVEVLDEAMPKVKVGHKVSLSGLTLKLISKLGQGGFASTYKAVVIESKKSLEVTTSSETNLTMKRQYAESDLVCVKVQKPACPWELYICRELRERMLYMDSDLDRDILTRVMHISPAALYSDGSLLVNDLVPFGSLLNLVNLAKAKKMMLHQSLIMYITIELLHTIEVLHRCKIIHGDIKPDNVLFIGFPELDKVEPFNSTSIKLIDYGRSIDISKFPVGTTFTASNQTDGFVCIEMKTERPWTYQTDLFGVLGTVYTMLFSSYMKVVYDSSTDKWRTSKPFSPTSRYYPSVLWGEMFDEFLNIPSCDEIPDVSEWRERFEEEFARMASNYSSAAATFNSVIASAK